MLGKKRGLQTTFWNFTCLLFVTNVFKMKEKVCSDQNPPPLFPFFSFFPFFLLIFFFCLSASYTPLSLQKPTKTPPPPSYSYLHLPVPTFLFYLQMSKITQISIPYHFVVGDAIVAVETEIWTYLYIIHVKGSESIPCVSQSSFLLRSQLPFSTATCFLSVKRV